MENKQTKTLNYNSKQNHQTIIKNKDKTKQEITKINKHRDFLLGKNDKKLIDVIE